MNILRCLGISACLTIVLTGPLAAQNLNLTIDGGPTPCAVPIASATVGFETDGDVNVGVTEANLQPCVPGAVAGAPVVNLTITPATVDSGNSVTADWTITNYSAGLTSCIPSGGTAVWQGTNIISNTNSSGVGSSSGGVPLSNPTNFTLTCTNGTGADTFAVTVNGGGGGGGIDPDPSLMCPTSRPPPVGVSRTQPFNYFDTSTSTTLVGTRYEDVWNSWPGGGTQTLFVPRDTYLAVAFETGAVGTMIFDWFGGPGQSLGQTLTISRCPGDFDEATFPDQSGCFAQGGGEGGTIRAVVGTSGVACDLLPNTLYFLNIGDFDPATPTVTTCGAATCTLIGAP